MIDIHCHVLPGLDDGARDLDEALAMLERAAADGTRTVVATPHYDGCDPDFPALVRERLDEVRRAAGARGIGVEVLGGFELAFSPALLQAVSADRSLGLAGGRYLLVELAPTLWSSFVLQGLRRLQGRGLRPILGHAERCQALQEDPERAESLVRSGVLLQVNADSLVRPAGSSRARCARELLRRGRVEFLASDAHGLDRRPCGLSAALEVAAGIVGHAAAERLVTTNPAAVVTSAGHSADVSRGQGMQDPQSLRAGVNPRVDSEKPAEAG